MKQIIGTWAANITEGDKSVTGTTTYKKNKEFATNATIIAPGLKVNIKVKGTWKIQNGHLVCNVTKSNAPRVVAEGSKIKDKILQLDDSIFQYKNKHGKIYTDRRIEE